MKINIEKYIRNFETLDVDNIKYFKISDQSMFSCVAMMNKCVSSFEYGELIATFRKICVLSEGVEHAPYVLQQARIDFEEMMQKFPIRNGNVDECIEEAEEIIANSQHDDEIPEWFNSTLQEEKFNSCLLLGDLEDDGVFEFLADSKDKVLYFYWE